ncbi:MAG: ribonuclease R [Candidatus Paceibacterota bacterium]|jgi:ribonuclease R
MKKKVGVKKPHLKKTQETHIEGFISINAKGVGYVKNRDRKEDVEIDHLHLNTALHGDTVRALLHPKKHGHGETGEITDVLIRGKAGFSGVLEKDDGTYFLVPSDIKMYTDIIIPAEELGGAEVGQKVFSVITQWNDPLKAPLGKITQVLGMPKENNAEMNAIALEKGFENTFPEDVLHEAETLKQEEVTEDEIAKRRDFRNVLTFTIDPFDAKDFDDAISIRKTDEDTYEIGIHIADVSHYVHPGTALDREAIRRSTSVYLVDRTIPMLPEVLSNDLCSLRPNVDRLTMSAVFTMTTSGHIKDSWYGRTIIHSDKRFTYEEAQEILDTKKGLHYEELNILNNIAKKLTKKRFLDGAISLEQDEVKFVLDPKGVPINVYRKIRGDTHKLVEEFMLLANRNVAEFIATLEKRENVFVYRVHGDPDKDRIADLVHFLKKLGYQIPTKDGLIPSHEINKLLETLEGKEEKSTISTAIVRSMAKAIYSTKNIGHYGLAFKYYAHFTSPIRRYPDVIVHRLLDDYLHGIYVPKERWHEYETLSNFSSGREKEASDAERASIKYKQVEYMSSRVGSIYDGVITGITEWGIFVEEKETKCEGMVRMRDLTDDFYTYQEKDMMIVGKKTKKKYRVGDKVKIKVVAADMNKKVIDYALV